MNIRLHAQPCDTSAVGFYFNSYEDYSEKAAALRNAHGDSVEEFEIQFIDGEDIDCDLAKAIGLNQASLEQYFEAVDDWDDDDKTRVILAVGECGYRFEDSKEPSEFDLDIYHVDTMRELAEHFVEEGLFGDIPERLQFYIDYDAIARDLSMDYAQVEVAGTRLIFRCA